MLERLVDTDRETEAAEVTRLRLTHRRMHWIDGLPSERLSPTRIDQIEARLEAKRALRRSAPASRT
jgi:hypothetical protein